MGRRVITTQLQSSQANGDVDTYFSKLVKYIPSDVVGGWVAATSAIRSDASAPTNLLLWIAFGAGVVFTTFWTLKHTKMPKKRPAITQAVISTGAFIVWVFALGEPFASLPFYRPLYGSLLLVLYTLFVALINPREDEISA